MKDLTAGEECSLASKVFNYFSDKAIPASFVASCLGVAISKGTNGTAVVRLSTGDWSAPCAFALYSSQTEIDPNQETVILFMSERSIIGLIKNERVILNQTHSFLPGPLSNENAQIEMTDMYVYVRFNAGMSGWQIGEDSVRHGRWHGRGGITWFDVLTNKISVDRSSVGNGLYLVLNLLAGRSKHKIAVKNFVETSKMVGPRPSDVQESTGIQKYQPQQYIQPTNTAPTLNMYQPQQQLAVQLTPQQIMQRQMSTQYQQPQQQQVVNTQLSYNQQQYQNSQFNNNPYQQSYQQQPQQFNNANSQLSQFNNTSQTQFNQLQQSSGMTPQQQHLYAMQQQQPPLQQQHTPQMYSHVQNPYVAQQQPQQQQSGAGMYQSPYGYQ